MADASARCDICGSDKIHAHSPYEVELERYIRPQFEEYFERNITVSGFHSSAFENKHAYKWGFDWKRRSKDGGVTDYHDHAVEVAWRLWRDAWWRRDHEITKACELACGVPRAEHTGAKP